MNIIWLKIHWYSLSLDNYEGDFIEEDIHVKGPMSIAI